MTIKLLLYSLVQFFIARRIVLFSYTLLLLFAFLNMLKIKNNPVSFHIVEKERKQCLMTWTYPAITEETKMFVISRCFSISSAVTESLFFYLRKNNIWIYINQFINKHGAIEALIITAEDIALRKYKIMSDIFIKKYVNTNNPVDLVKLYLNLVVSGSVCYKENGAEMSLDLRSFCREETDIKGIINDFGLEIILLYNAILLKRRILVYHFDIEKLQQKLLAITNLAPIRNPNEYLYPLIENIQELKGISFYLAGTIEEHCATKEKYYELYVNLVSKEIVIRKEAKEYFTVSKIHKDLAQCLVQLSESELNEAKIIDEIETKTNDILTQLNSMATCMMGSKKMLSLQDLKSKKFNPALENFLFNLAVAENIMML